MKKLISTILTLALIFAVNTTAFASEANKALPAAESVETTEVFFGNTDAVRIGSSEETRSTSLPTSYWSLAQRSYTADLQVVGKHWLYTNYYYHPNGDGKIYVDYSVRADTSTTTFYICLPNCRFISCSFLPLCSASVSYSTPCPQARKMC